MRGAVLWSCALLLSWTVAAAGQESTSTPRFSARVDQVVVYASVYNDEYQLVTGLERENFQIYEDGVEQEITSFAQTEVPSTIGIVLDTSGSMRRKMPEVEDAIDLFLSQNNPQNELFLIRFDDEVELEEDFTREEEDIRDAIANFIVKGGTALYDAIYLSVDKAREGAEPKKVVVVFTDGEDKDSYYTHEELTEKVMESETQVFVVAFLSEELSEGGGFFGIFKSQREKVRDEIEDVASVTGGRAYFPEEVGELDGIFQDIAFELKNQYRISYISSNSRRNGKWREIDVRIDGARERGLRIRAKKGYYGPAGDGSESSDPS